MLVKLEKLGIFMQGIGAILLVVVAAWQGDDLLDSITELKKHVSDVKNIGEEIQKSSEEIKKIVRETQDGVQSLLKVPEKKVEELKSMSAIDQEGHWKVFVDKLKDAKLVGEEPGVLVKKLTFATDVNAVNSVLQQAADKTMINTSKGKENIKKIVDCFSLDDCKLDQDLKFK